MATLFYIILVIFSPNVGWGWGWFIASLFFSGGERIVYKYTNNPQLDGEETY